MLIQATRVSLLFFSVPGEPLDTRPLENSIDNEEDVEDVSSSQVPWMVSLGGFKTSENWEHQCGGSLITGLHVLTAAHCAELTASDRNYIKGAQMRLGTGNMTNPSLGIVRNIVNFINHPNFTPGRPYFDVAIVVTNVQIDFTKFIRPIALPMRPIDDEDSFDDELVTLSGWGLPAGGEVNIKQRQTSNLLHLKSIQGNIVKIYSVRKVCLNKALEHWMLYYWKGKNFLMASQMTLLVLVMILIKLPPLVRVILEAL